DHRCRRQRLYSPVTEYFASDRSKSSSPFSRTLARFEPCRNSSRARPMDSGVMMAFSTSGIGLYVTDKHEGLLIPEHIRHCGIMGCGVFPPRWTSNDCES